MFCRGEYQSDTSHLDGDLPFGVQLIHGHGPRYSVETYLPRWHYEKAIEILEEERYEALVEFAPGEELCTGGGSETLYWRYDIDTNAVIQERIEPGVWAGSIRKRRPSPSWNNTESDESRTSPGYTCTGGNWRQLVPGKQA